MVSRVLTNLRCKSLNVFFDLYANTTIKEITLDFFQTVRLFTQDIPRNALHVISVLFGSLGLYNS